MLPLCKARVMAGRGGVCLINLFCSGISMKEMSKVKYLEKRKNEAVYQSKDIVKA